MNRRHGWRFAALGKHPGAGDYIFLGDDFPLAGAMAVWLGKACDRGEVDPEQMDPAAGVAFWSRGGADGHPACGLLAPSWDSMGRSYPLLVLGVGPLDGWTDRWDMLPVALSPTWQGMRDIACSRKGATEYLRRKVEELLPPHDDWLVHSATRRDRLEREADRLPRPAVNDGAKQSLLRRGVLPLQTRHNRGEDVIWLWHAALKKWADGIFHPEGALLWWNDARVRLLLLRRAIVPADLKAMLHTEEEDVWT
jgi:type VI secretion system protein VasJ